MSGPSPAGDGRNEQSSGQQNPQPPSWSLLRPDALPFFQPGAPPIPPTLPAGFAQPAYGAQANSWNHAQGVAGPPAFQFPWQGRAAGNAPAYNSYNPPFYLPNWQGYGYAAPAPHPAQPPAYGAFQPFGQPQNISYPAYGQFHQQIPLPEHHQGSVLSPNVYGSSNLTRDHKTKSYRTDKHDRSVPGQGKKKKKKNKNNDAANFGGIVGGSATHDSALNTSVQGISSGSVSAPNQTNVTARSGRRKDVKIKLPAPQPTADYLSNSLKTPSLMKSPSRMLVVLDLNGTLLYRGSRNPRHFVERPFLKPFLRYLFDNFSVMVWSSAQPENVYALVDSALPPEFRSKLVTRWARDTFGLAPQHYYMNVQVYKDLSKIWSDLTIQASHPGFVNGEVFDQRNTILIDDTVEKASAQPYNLLEIPEFTATPEQMTRDFLREVAGYLEVVRQYDNASAFIRQEPFQADGQWQYDWPHELNGSEIAGGQAVGGEVIGSQTISGTTVGGPAVS
jgi:hypothetical protein